MCIEKRGREKTTSEKDHAGGKSTLEVRPNKNKTTVEIRPPQK